MFKKEINFENFYLLKFQTFINKQKENSKFIFFLLFFNKKQLKFKYFLINIIKKY